MARVVNFMIPASATAGFASQVAAFYSALQALRWTDWRPTVSVCFGEPFPPDVYNSIFQRFPQLRHINATFADSGPPNNWFYNQIDGLYRFAQRDADAYVRADADILPVGDLEPVLNLICGSSAIAGTIAHYRFPDSRYRNRSAWSAIAAHADCTLSFDYCYSLSDTNQTADERATPFYLNDGCVFFSKRYFERFVPLYLQLRPRLMPHLEMPYFGGQISLALAVAQIDLPKLALPQRFNFPNDEKARHRYPEELADARIIHYLRDEEFSRSRIFSSDEDYRAFLAAPLNPTNCAFRDRVRSVLGDSFPFQAGPGPEIELDTPTQDSRPLAENYISIFQATSALERLMRARQALAANHGRQQGYERYLHLMGLAPSIPLLPLSLIGQGKFAEDFAHHFKVTYRGGKSFTVEPVKVIGEGMPEALHSLSRTTHIACLPDVIVRGRSALIQTRNHALLEFQDEELDLFDCEFDIDPAIFAGSRHQVSVIDGATYPGRLDLDEAFTLLGPQ